MTDSNEISAAQRDRRVAPHAVEGSAALVHPHQLEVQEFASYSLVIDARSPHEFADDHIPGAINLPVVDDVQYAEVGTTHRNDTHAAYLIGVEYSLRNIAAQIRPLIASYTTADRFLVYCFRGGKRSRLWADNLRTIGFTVDVLAGGWKNYRRWVRAGLESLPRALHYRVLAGPTGCGKTRLLQALARQGEQVLDLEALAVHRGSLLGDLPGQPQPSQKLFDSRLLDALRRFSPTRAVWLEAESKKIGNIHLPEPLHEAIHQSGVVSLKVPMAERVRLWREDYAHFAEDPVAMVDKLAPLKPLIGSDELKRLRTLASAGLVDELFERIMVVHYDPCYARSTYRDFVGTRAGNLIEVESLSGAALGAAAERLIARDASLLTK